MIDHSMVSRTQDGVWSGTTTAWASVAPAIVPLGQIGVDTTSAVVKIGDGVTAWATLPALGAGGGGGDMLAANNLSDVASVPASRANLGLSVAATRAEIAERYLDGGGVVSSTIERSRAKDVITAGASGVMHSTAVFIEAGQVVTDITFRSVAAAVTPTSMWFALYDTASTPALIAQTPDQGAAAWPSNTTRTLALPAPYTAPTTGVYYVSIMVAAATVPALLGWSGLIGASGAIITGQRSIAQTSGTGLTATAPATITGATVTGATPYAILR